MDIDVKNIERYWQKVWEDEKSFIPTGNNKPKFFNFDSAPFPNGNLHLGHVRNYVLGDIIARYKRLNGYDVLYTTNFDSFGLPNQLEAEKQSRKPEQYTKECISLIKDDLKRLGISYDWSRVNSTSDPKYYKWTQWLFLELYSAGMVYRKETRVNWCDKCNSVLANMEVEAGKCNRCNNIVEIKYMPQWFIALSEYSSELYESIDDLTGWSDRAKKLVKGFIGKTTGSLVSFSILDKSESVEVFLPAKDKLVDVTFVAATMDDLEQQNLSGVRQDNSTPGQQLKSIPVSKRRRHSHNNGNRIGLDSGIKLIHPISGISIPLFYVNYLSNEVGPSIKTGTPVSNQADKMFSEEYKIPEINKCAHDLGVHAISVKDKNYYHVHDWVVSRQKKWGTPMPMIECPACGFVPVTKENLPVISHFDEACKNGKSSRCPVCAKNAKAVTDTLDCYIDDVWCFLSSELNSKNDFSIEKAYDLDWFPADHYHAGYDIYMYLHLYRFITRFLYKRGYVKTPEPITVYFGHDMVLQDGKKMSKRHNNSQNMQLLLDEHGADVVRVAMILMANPDRPVRWDNEMLKRSRKLVFKVFELASLLLNLKNINVEPEESELDVVKKESLEKISIRLNKEITKYIDSYRPGSAIQSLEKYTKEVYKIIHSLSVNNISSANYLYLKKYVLTLCVLYSPFAPHISEEVWHRLGGEGRVAQAKWPVC